MEIQNLKIGQIVKLIGRDEMVKIIDLPENDWSEFTVSPVNNGGAISINSDQIESIHDN